MYIDSSNLLYAKEKRDDSLTLKKVIAGKVRRSTALSVFFFKEERELSEFITEAELKEWIQ